MDALWITWCSGILCVGNEHSFIKYMSDSENLQLGKIPVLNY